MQLAINLAGSLLWSTKLSQYQAAIIRGINCGQPSDSAEVRVSSVDSNIIYKQL